MDFVLFREPPDQQADFLLDIVGDLSLYSKPRGHFVE